MQNDASYYAAAVYYNEEAACFFENLTESIKDPRVAKWTKRIARQHRDHMVRHQKALEKLQSMEAESDSGLLETADAPTEEKVLSSLEVHSISLDTEPGPYGGEINVLPCPEAAYHVDEGTGYFDPNGHHITEARYYQINGDNA